MTDFVLRDLGLCEYESYILDAEHRPYNSNLEIQQHWMLHELEISMDSAESSDEEMLLAWFEAVYLNIDQKSPLYSN